MQGARLLIGIPVDQSAIHSIVGARPGGSAFSVGVRSRRLSRRDGQRLLQTEALNQLGKEEGMKGKKVGRGKSRATKKPLGLKNPAACACLARSSSRSHGVPMGIRTPVLTVRGSCPRPLDDGDERLSIERHHCTTWQKNFKSPGGKRSTRHYLLLDLS